MGIRYRHAKVRAVGGLVFGVWVDAQRALDECMGRRPASSTHPRTFPHITNKYYITGGGDGPPRRVLRPDGADLHRPRAPHRRHARHRHRGAYVRVNMRAIACACMCGSMAPNSNQLYILSRSPQLHPFPRVRCSASSSPAARWPSRTTTPAAPSSSACPSPSPCSWSVAPHL